MAKNFVHGGDVYSRNENGAAWIDFSANINPLGLAEPIYEKILQSIEKIVHYPDIRAEKLKTALKNFYHIEKNQIVLGNGAAEIFYTMLFTLRPKKIVIPVPSFNEYERASLAAGCAVDYFLLEEKNNFSVDFEKLATIEADAILLGNPNNPTGGAFTQSEIFSFLKTMQEKDTAVLIDESFLDFFPEENFSCRSLVGKPFQNLFVIQSLTKFYAIPGLRLGFGVAPERFAEKFFLAHDPWNVNLFAQEAGVVALSEKLDDYREQTRRTIAIEKKFLCDELKKFSGIKIFHEESCVNFLLLKLAPEIFLSAKNFCENLRKENILVRNCDNYVGLDENFVRIAVRSCKENQCLINAIKKIFFS